MRAQHCQRVPNAGLNIDAKRIASQDVDVGYLPGVVEREERQFAVQHDESFGLRGIAVPMRSDVSSPDHHVQKPMRIVFHARVEVVIRPQSRRLARALDEGGDERRVEYLHG